MTDLTLELSIPSGFIKSIEIGADGYCDITLIEDACWRRKRRVN
jgi:hypothetical protein